MAIFRRQHGGVSLEMLVYVCAVIFRNKKTGNASFHVVQKSQHSLFFYFENHLARPKTAHFQTDTAVPSAKNGHIGLSIYSMMLSVLM